jgi:hypothetical protein
MTMLRSVLYTSASTIRDEAVDVTIARILTEAIAFNLEADITGALLFTGKRFAQIMEGGSEPVGKLLQRLRDDSHHRNLIVLRDVPISVRQFGIWQMAYAGPSAFVASTVERAVAGATQGSPGAVQSLTKMMVEFTKYS